MSDKFLPPEGISEGAVPVNRSERRAFLRRAVGVGVPVVLATVRGRSVLADDTTASGSGCLSGHTSGWLHRDDGEIGTRRQACIDGKYIDADGNPLPASGSGSFAEPPVDSGLPAPEESTSGKGKGNGKGGKPK